MTGNLFTRSAWLLPVLLVVGVAGCAAGAKQGKVVMAISNREAHISLGQGQVSVGDRVALFREECKRSPRGYPGACRKVQLGTGTVTEVLGDRYSGVRLDPGAAQIAEGVFVERTTM